MDRQQIIIHLDLDAFYCSCEQALNPFLCSVPFAIQQKHIVVTYAKRCCSDLIIINGEDIQKYRDTSKAVFRHVRSLVGNKVQRLGMDELWIDATDLIVHHEAQRNIEHTNHLFQVHAGASFPYNSQSIAGRAIGKSDDDLVCRRLQLATHLAAFLRESIRSEFSLTSSGGISCSKLIAKLVGDVHKPNDQTVIFPQFHSTFLDSIEVKKIAGVGYVILKTLFERLEPLAAPPMSRTIEVPLEPDEDYGASIVELHDDEDDDAGEEDKLISKQKEELLATNRQILTVAQVKSRVSSAVLISWLGSEKGMWLWDILHARDDSVIVPSSLYPKSIGVEDSFPHCITLEEVRSKLLELTTDLVYRMELDLTVNGKWIRWPSNIKLTPRFRGDQGKGQWWKHKRTSRSMPLPVEVFATDKPSQERTVNLVDRVLLPLFNRICAGKGDWDLSLLNVGVSDFKLEAPSPGICDYLDVSRSGRKRKQLDVQTLDLCPAEFELEVWRALDEPTRQELLATGADKIGQSQSQRVDQSQALKKVRFQPVVRAHEELNVSEAASASLDEAWPEEEDTDEGYLCEACQSMIPGFAIEDHVCV